jgi:soluble lytic murein transglycosylase-like protein
MGAIGLMQVRPITAVAVDLDSQGLLDPFHNLTVGITYLAYLRARYLAKGVGDSLYVLIAAYNLGPTRMDELLSRPGFKPDKTKRYFDAIRREQRCFKGHSCV